MSIPDIRLPVTLESAKRFLRVKGQDDLITDLIIESRKRIEQIIKATLIIQDLAFTSNLVRRSHIFIDNGSIRSIRKISVIDSWGKEVTIPRMDFHMNKTKKNIFLNNEEIFSDYKPDCISVKVEFSAGYGAAPDDIPLPIRQALLLLLVQSYEYRDEAMGRPVPMMADALLMPYRTMRK